MYVVLLNAQLNPQLTRESQTLDRANGEDEKGHWLLENIRSQDLLLYELRHTAPGSWQPVLLYDA